MSADAPILVGVDGSEASSRAVAWAARAAATRGAPLRLLTAVHVPAVYYSEPYLAHSFHEELADNARGRLSGASTLAKRAAEDIGPLEVTREALEGRAAPVLIDASEDVSMIVLGPQGHGEVTNLIVGSVTTSVAAHAHCPVAVVRGRSLDGRSPTVGPIVVGIDWSPTCEPAIETAFREAAARDAVLVAVHVWSDAEVHQRVGRSDDAHWDGVQSAEEAKLAERLTPYQEQYPSVVVSFVVARDRPVRVLREYSEQAQLIVVGGRGRGGFAGLLMGSTSTSLLHTADCPVLIVRPPR